MSQTDLPFSVILSVHRLKSLYKLHLPLSAHVFTFFLNNAFKQDYLYKPCLHEKG